MLSRESRISLPEEAKRYYANLSDSPMPSPNVGASGFPSGSGQSSPVKPQLSQVVEVPEVLRSHSGTPSHASSSTRASGEQSRKSADELAPFLDMGDEDSEYSGLEDRAVNGESAYDGMDDGQTYASKGAVVEDFPLPPSTTTFSTGEGQANSDSAQLSVQPAAPGTPVSPLPLSSAPTQMKFRALPLLASDLPHTEVLVVTSTIRPNERGKEVLSFIICVDPGKGKEPWNVEKLYSDVLGLDARVRASVSKNVIKRMIALPEGRLWRDHAPAKVDQRKVRHSFVSVSSLRLASVDNSLCFPPCTLR